MRKSMAADILTDKCEQLAGLNDKPKLHLLGTLWAEISLCADMLTPCPYMQVLIAQVNLIPGRPFFDMAVLGWLSRGPARTWSN